jgi:hypothetical protein
VDVVGFYIDVVQVLEAEDITAGGSAMGLGDDPAEKEP